MLMTNSCTWLSTPPCLRTESRPSSDLLPVSRSCSSGWLCAGSNSTTTKLRWSSLCQGTIWRCMASAHNLSSRQRYHIIKTSMQPRSADGSTSYYGIPLTAVSVACNYHLLRLSSIRHYLTIEVTGTAVQALTTSHLDCCNSLFINIPAVQLECLQHLQNKAACL